MASVIDSPPSCPQLALARGMWARTLRFLLGGGLGGPAAGSSSSAVGGGRGGPTSASSSSCSCGGLGGPMSSMFSVGTGALCHV